MLQDLDCTGFIVTWINLLLFWLRWGRILTKSLSINFVFWNSLRAFLACECCLASHATLGAGLCEQEVSSSNAKYFIISGLLYNLFNIRETKGRWLDESLSCFIDPLENINVCSMDDYDCKYNSSFDNDDCYVCRNELNQEVNMSSVTKNAVEAGGSSGNLVTALLAAEEVLLLCTSPKVGQLSPRISTRKRLCEEIAEEAGPSGFLEELD